MLRTVAHDLRNPIAGIKSMALILTKKDLPHEVSSSLQLIYAACSDAMDLIKDLLTYRKKGMVIPKEMVELRRLIQQCCNIMKLRAEEKRQQLKVKLVNVTISAQREKIYRVISNLISNAIKFSPEHTEIIVTLHKKESTVLISVKDHGISIPVHLQEKIFSIDPEGQRVGTAGEEFFGLGLAICHKIVQEHNGSLWFTSEEGKGTDFFVELPAR